MPDFVPEDRREHFITDSDEFVQPDGQDPLTLEDCSAPGALNRIPRDMPTIQGTSRCFSLETRAALSLRTRKAPIGNVCRKLPRRAGELACATALISPEPPSPEVARRGSCLIRTISSGAVVRHSQFTRGSL
jgi:hypothetical protein